MRRFVSFLGIVAMCSLPLSTSAQQITLDLDPAVYQQFVQLQQPQASSTVGFQLQQNLQQYLPVAQTYLSSLTSSGDTEAIIARLEAILKPPGGGGENQPLIDALLAQVAALQEQINALLTASSTATATSTIPTIPAEPPILAGLCPIINRTLTVGMNGDDVTSLQQFLISAGHLEAGLSTGFFGALTQAAVQAWQAAQGVVSSGSPEETGFGVVGPKTRIALENCTA